MSVWTHVVASIRIDAFRIFDDSPNVDTLKSIIGNPCTINDWNPDTTIPMGSEGSLEYTIYENPNKSHICAFVVTIFGDLRDYDNVDAIYDWLYSLCKKIENNEMSIRNSAAQIECENGVIRTFDYITTFED